MRTELAASGELSVNLTGAVTGSRRAALDWLYATCNGELLTVDSFLSSIADLVRRVGDVRGRLRNGVVLGDLRVALLRKKIERDDSRDNQHQRDQPARPARARAVVVYDGMGRVDIARGSLRLGNAFFDHGKSPVCYYPIRLNAGPRGKFLYALLAGPESEGDKRMRCALERKACAAGRV